MKHPERLSKNTSSAILLLLIVVLLGLGSCSVKKAFHTIWGSPALSQQAPAASKSPAPAACSATEKILSQDLGLAQAAFASLLPFLPASIPSGLPDYGISSWTGKQQAFSSRSHLLLHLKTIPLYLRNNSFLI